MVAVRPLLLGIEGYSLTAGERAFIKEAPPMGFLLFARNVQSVEQVRDLTAELVENSPFKAPLVAVDQEGGRVQRIKFGGKIPPMKVFGEWYVKAPEQALEGVRLAAFLLSAQLRDVGATWLLGPLLDVANPATHAIIGDRSFSENPETVIKLGTAYAQGIYEGGCLRCLKHAPGHGKATTDSHFELPAVDASLAELQADLAPFKAMAKNEDFLMTAHIRYAALDKDEPASYSRSILDMMRKDWSFNGLILADDVGMKALQGDYVGRVAKSLDAGCDVAITALSVLRHGMAGTVFDQENFDALVRADIPSLNAKAQAYLEKLVLPDAPSAESVANAKQRLIELWADVPTAMGYSLEL
ncbi:MAG: beta-N-acetylhexosaminidase [Pseudomonas fluorescens]|nr:MAG: beta-N-acetylhexosaminidase [Pseudomonas fluorescens]